MNFFEEYHELLYNCNKPYQYVGGEFLSRNKSFEEAKIRFAFVFPDKYEIGISNLGVRILYGLVNDHADFMADRAYAPEVDFKDEIGNLKKDFYAVESKRPLKDFDLVTFSLQYELSYPTVLKILEMSDVSIRNEDRREDEPIVLAGGPCTFNPLVMSKFIDAFTIGDGEDVVIEVCEALKEAKEQGLSRDEKLKKLSEIKGVWVVKYSKPVEKRIAQLTYENALKAYPVPFSSSVHDRATIEIRRGCGRMCRFCQPGHVTLPLRERQAQDVIKISKELVKNTGYDEYSLLSLSSNDYSNIKEVIKELAVDFTDKKVSVSLPSQRIDGFSLELANLVQEVRKSAMTLAPEAGSQRLRDAIKKNITREQIIDAALTLYENGWSRIKFYFIVGLPTETYEDLDEMAELLAEIRYKSRYVKKIKELKHSLDVTCTLSIFVPKPFTPFQWAPQVNLEELTQRIYYLKDKTKHIKGLKINYHEKFVSQIEAVLTRGDEKLCDYIEALYKKGCYLDAWGENFDKEVWQNTAQELGISLSDLAEKQYDLDENLPWDFINVGLDKSWLQNEYRAAFSITQLHMKNLRKQAIDYYRNNIQGNTVVHPQLGEIKFGIKSGKKYKAFSRDLNKLKIIEKLRQIVQTATFTHCDNNNKVRKDNIFKFYRLINTIKLNNKKYNVFITVVEDENGKRFYDLAENKNPPESNLVNQIQAQQEDINIIAHSKMVFNPTCETGCVNCGVCKNLKVHKVVAPQYVCQKVKPQKDLNTQKISQTYKYRIKLTKKGILRYFSHLDWQGTFLKALARTGLDIAFSQGFNPSMKVSLGVALPLFIESECELVDIELNEEISTENLKLKLEKVLPSGCQIKEIKELSKEALAIDHTVQWAQYRVKLFDKGLHNFESLMYNMNKVLSSDEILLTKKNKKGILKTTNIKPSIKSYEIKDDSLYIVLKTGQGNEIPAIRIDDLMKIIAPEIVFDISRIEFYDQDVNVI